VSFSFGFAEPFYTGTASVAVVSDQVPFPYPCALGGRGYLIDTRQYERRTLPLLRESFDSTGEPGEQTLATEGIWKRNASDWSLGAGQRIFDEEGSDRRRFFSSKGVDPWDLRRLCLLSATDEKKNATNSNLDCFEAGNHLYFIDGTAAHYTLDPSPDSPTWSTHTGAPASIVSVTTSGTHIYAAVSTAALQRATIGTGTFANFGTYTADFVLYANGRLLAGDGAELVEVGSGGGTTALFTHFSSSFSWSVGASTPQGIIVGGNNGDQGEFYFVGYDTTSGALLPATPAGSLNRGETIHAMEFYQGLMVLGTSRGLRLGLLTDNNRGVQAGPVIEIGKVEGLALEGEFCWFGWTNYDGVSTGVGRAKLSRFTDTLVPAYASDLMVTSTAAVTGVARFKGRTYFAVSADGLYGPHPTDLVASGTINSGWIGYSAFERKVASSFDLRHEPLNGIIRVELEDESGTVSLLGSSTNPTSLTPNVAFPGGNVDGEQFRVLMTLERSGSDATKGPCLVRWTLRSVVAPAQVDEIILPILLFETVDTWIGEGEDRDISTISEYLFLKGLEASHQVITYQEGTASYPVTVREVAVREPRGWNTDRTFFDTVLFVRMITTGG